ncbi:MAG: tRNA (guanine(10)-N(2))-dimethyltransferase [Candidatus Woesearchaeota archaeon]|nr:tRNA (guanine(10)-N(2))-dimethyltransferase [Candidatus Woesearchaeota archaeon]
MTKSVFTEGKARFAAPRADKVSRDMSVFYNPAMKLNRDITVAVLSACELTGIYACDIMAATGVRTIRLAKELPEGKLKRIYANDMSHDAVMLLKKNLKLNKIKFENWKKEKERSKNKTLKVIISEKDANMFLLESNGFDYIDIDPFGSPNPFIDSALKRISRGGILAITATDTAPLSGTFEKACERKYYGKPCRNAYMHETGLRMLIRKAQLIGSQYGRALIPIFSYYNLHYFRVFFRCEKSKELADEIIKEHGYLLYCRKCLTTKKADSVFNEKKCSCGQEFSEIGPIYLGKLWDKTLVSKMKKDSSLEKFLSVIESEERIEIPFFYLVGEVCKRSHLSVPKKSMIISGLKKHGLEASETHFDPEGIKTNASPEKIVEMIIKLNSKK